MRRWSSTAIGRSDRVGSDQHDRVRLRGTGSEPARTGRRRHLLCPGEDRVAGGSTSGGAVAVALGAADIALGSDTSGSIRIPAAFCGVAGFKPSQGRYPSGGMIPLSPSFDAPGSSRPPLPISDESTTRSGSGDTADGQSDRSPETARPRRRHRCGRHEIKSSSMRSNSRSNDSRPPG